LCGAANRQARSGNKIRYALTLAREHWATAKAMVERMGYRRRDREVEEITLELGESA